MQAQLPPDSVVPGDLNGQETDVVFIYSLSCNALKNSALVNRQRQQHQVLSISCLVALPLVKRIFVIK